MYALALWLGFLVPLAAGCGFMVHDKGSEITYTGVSLVYTDWVAPETSKWQTDSYECTRDAQEAVPTYLGRLFGRTQVHAERCMVARGYTRR
jgi:hypothetical protein